MVGRTSVVRSDVSMAFLAAASLALTACHPRGSTTPISHEVTPPPLLDPAAIHAWLTHEVRARGLVGVAVVIVRDGRVILARGYGTRTIGTREVVSADTPFAIGSVSKELTCAAVMSLVDEGRLSMQSPVATYYPALTSASEITLDDLGAHVAGYRDYYPLDYADGRMATAIAPDDLIARYGGLPLDSPPRSRWSYSNTGFVLLARIIERVAGVPLATLLQQRIFAPLGMNHTTLGRPPASALPSTGHVAFALGDPEPTEPEAPGWLFGAGSVWASAADLARWDLGFMNGEVLSAAARSYMTTPHVTSDGRSTDYGCGLEVREVRGEQVLSHSGEVAGFLAYNAFVPRTRSAVVVLSNHMHIDVGPLHEQLLGLVLDDPSRVPTVRGPPAAEAARALIRQMQRGSVDRTGLSPEFSQYLDDRHLAAAAPRLSALGDPAVTVVRLRERGGMELAVLEVAFATRTVGAWMFRSPDGSIHQLLLFP
jgi:CubicO group peptidase (beta-lactamase class C family)